MPFPASTTGRFGLLASRLLLSAVCLSWAACAPAPEDSTASDMSSGEVSGTTEAVESAVERPEFALAIHGGAGVIPKDMAPEKVAAYEAALESALTHGRDRLAAGASALDVVEEVVKMLEDAPEFNAGKGAVFTNDGRNELDAAIMDGRDKSCGAVARMTTVKNPITVARGVMERSRHVFMVGEGAEAFADELGVERVDKDYFFTQRRYDQWQKALEREREAEAQAEKDKHGTVGCVALDKEGNLAAATSTGGMTNKRFGRIGDVPVIGAGTYADNETAAISCTGKGEEFIRHNVAHAVSSRMALAGESLQAAAEAVIHGTLAEGDGGLIAVGHDGSIAMVFNSPGMFRGAADATGRFDVAIWE